MGTRGSLIFDSTHIDSHFFYHIFFFADFILNLFLFFSLTIFMGDPPRSPSTDPYSILTISKDLCKAYKSLFNKFHSEKSPISKTEVEAKSPGIKNETYKVRKHTISHASFS